jgi:hypothetical protein
LGAKIRQNEFGVEWLEHREDGSSESLGLLCRLDLRLALGLLALGLLGRGPVLSNVHGKARL